MKQICGIMIVAACWTGCDGGSASSEPAALPEAQKAPAAQEPNAAGPNVDDPTFKLALARGDDGALRLSLEGRGGYHVNQDFPFSADFSDSSKGVTLGKQSLSKADARLFNEQGATFEVPLEVAQPAQQVRAKVRFAVCTDESCVPDTRTLVLDVEP